VIAADGITRWLTQRLGEHVEASETAPVAGRGML